jgi:exopolysaccharide biosynthesis polyprenyl glycosylphosphotransferase
LIVDVAAIFVARALLRSIRAGLLGSGPGALTTSFFPLGTIPSIQLIVAIVVSFFFLGCYREGHRWQEAVKILTATGVGTAVAFYADLWHGSPHLIIGRALLVWLLLGPTLVAARSLVGVLLRSLPRVGLRHKVLEVTSPGSVAGGLGLGSSYALVASVDQDHLPSTIEDMENWLDGGVDTILVRGDLSGERFRTLTDFALTHGCRLLCAPYGSKAAGVEKKRVWIEGHPLLEFTTPGLRASHLVLKRALDLTLAGLSLVVLSPVMLLIAAWIKLDSPGPVLFRQRRPGIRGRDFPMLKFRSMRVDAEDVLKRNELMYARFVQNGCKLPEGEDPRITRVGRFLRATSLDELPQLFNVLRGDMSLVGPRPLVGPELENYEGRVSTLLSVKPGLTGPWQVSGRSRISFPERAEIDLEYVRNWSFLGDLWLLLLTPAAVLIRRGAH